MLYFLFIARNMLLSIFKVREDLLEITFLWNERYVKYMGRVECSLWLDLWFLAAPRIVHRVSGRALMLEPWFPSMPCYSLFFIVYKTSIWGGGLQSTFILYFISGIFISASLKWQTAKAKFLKFWPCYEGHFHCEMY